MTKDRIIRYIHMYPNHTMRNILNEIFKYLQFVEKKIDDFIGKEENPVDVDMIIAGLNNKVASGVNVLNQKITPLIQQIQEIRTVVNESDNTEVLEKLNALEKIVDKLEKESNKQKAKSVGDKIKKAKK